MWSKSRAATVVCLLFVDMRLEGLCIRQPLLDDVGEQCVHYEQAIVQVRMLRLFLCRGKMFGANEDN